eukprot:6174198-Pleurochrysis_carterae.AAC.2
MCMKRECSCETCRASQSAFTQRATLRERQSRAAHLDVNDRSAVDQVEAADANHAALLRGTLGTADKYKRAATRTVPSDATHVKDSSFGRSCSLHSSDDDEDRRLLRRRGHRKSTWPKALACGGREGCLVAEACEAVKDAEAAEAVEAAADAGGAYRVAERLASQTLTILSAESAIWFGRCGARVAKSPTLGTDPYAHQRRQNGKRRPNAASYAAQGKWDCSNKELSRGNPAQMKIS